MYINCNILICNDFLHFALHKAFYTLNNNIHTHNFKSHFLPPYDGYNNRLTVHCQKLDNLLLPDPLFTGLSDVHVYSGDL